MAEETQIPEVLSALFREADAVGEELERMLPDLAEARRTYCASRSEEDRRQLEDIEKRAKDLHAKHGEIVTAMQVASGIPEEVLAELEGEQVTGDPELILKRGDLTETNVATTGLIEDVLADSVESLRGLVDADWLNEFAGSRHKLGPKVLERPMSLVRGLRPEGEFPPIHRFAQAILVAQDFLNEDPEYDHFAGALLVPQVAMLGKKLQFLDEVGGEVETRLNSLWRGPSEESDSMILELLVAARCAERGRRVEFLTPQSVRTPDLRCHDPYPLLIECKRKRSLSDYELHEERNMRVLFNKLDDIARAKGVWGCFDLELSIESDQADHDEIVGCLTRQRLAAHPGRPLEYPWGKVAYRELPRRLSLPRTRLYSPNMMRFAFGWDSDLPAWDGIICRIGSPREMVVDEIQESVALLWTNTSDRAISKRSWGPTDIFGDATNQIPPGEFGMIYVAYQEGTREQIADLRTQNFIKRIREWDHPASIRIPISVLIRLYPRPLNEGQPDLIENAVYLVSGEYGEPALTSEFPAAVFTDPGGR